MGNFGHKSFLMVGSVDAADIVSLIKGGYEILECHFGFNQGIDAKGKATTRVHSGTITVTLSQLPPLPIIEWAMNPRKSTDGMIVLVDEENVPVEKTIFRHAACTSFHLDYTHSGTGYAATRITIEAEQLVVCDDITFTNEWITD